MGLFDKQEKKLRKEFNKKNKAYCEEGYKELEELYEELKTAYKTLDDVTEEFTAFRQTIAEKLNDGENAKMDSFLKRFKKIDKIARDAVRDIHDLLRSQKKRLREVMNDE